MEIKRVLFVCGFPLIHNTSATFQNRLLIKGLKKLGFSIDVICPEPDNTSTYYDESLSDILNYINRVYYVPWKSIYKRALRVFRIKKHSVTGSDLINGHHAKTKFKNQIRKLLSMLFNLVDLDGSIRLNLRSVKKINLNLNEYHLLISSSDPKCAHTIAQMIFRRSKAKLPWIQYWGDPWFKDVNLRKRWKKFLVYYLESKLLKSADKIVYASPITLKEQIKLFPKYADKMLYINQASEENNLNFEDMKDKTVNISISPSIGYFGDYFSKIRNILPFYNSADHLQRVKFLIVGEGDLDLKNKQNVTVIKERLSFNAIKKLERETEILFAVCNKSGSQIPAKIYYWASYRRKPIIVAVDGEYKAEIKKFLQNFGRYIICENTPESIVNAIKEAIQNLEHQIVYNIPHELTYEGMVKGIIASVIDSN